MSKVRLFSTKQLSETIGDDWFIKRDSLLVGGILILGLILRLLLAFYIAPHPERYIQGDAEGYDQLARNLSNGLGFSMSEQAPYIPDNFRTPVYPYFLATIYTIFGYRPELVLVFQVLISTSLIFVVYKLGTYLKNPKVGLIAAVLVTISPYMIVYTVNLWSDLLFTFLLSISLMLTLRMISTCELRWAVMSGVLLGIATLTHPRSLYLPSILAIIALVYFLRHKHSIRRSLLILGAYLLTFALILLPWQIRNYMLFGVSNLSSVPGINLLFYNVAITEASQIQGDHWEIAREYEASIREANNYSLNEARFSKEASALAWKIILSDPIPHLKTHFIGTAKVFSPGIYTLYSLLSGETDNNQEYVFSLATIASHPVDTLLSLIQSFSPMILGLICINVAYLISIYLLSFITVIREFRKNHYIWILILSIVYLSGVVGAAGSPRFQIAFIPLLCVLGAMTFDVENKT